MSGPRGSLSVLLVLAALAGCGDAVDDPCPLHLGALCDPGVVRGALHEVDDVVAIDLDGDEILEVVSASRHGGAVSIIREGASTISIALPGPSAIAAADVDGDGFPEIAVALADSDAVVLVDDALGEAPAISAPIEVGDDPRDLWLGDLDGDGLPEWITADAGGTITIVRAADHTSSSVPVGVSPVALDVGDLDMDGLLDLVVVDFEGGALQLLRGLPGAAFASPVVIPVEPGIEDLDLADVDGDGDLDALVRGRTSGIAWRCDGDGSGGLGPAVGIDLAGTSDGRGIVGFPADAAGPGGLVSISDRKIATWFIDQGVVVGRESTPAINDVARISSAGEHLIATGPSSVAVGALTSPSFPERWRLDFTEPAVAGPAARVNLNDDEIADLAVTRGSTLVLLLGVGGGAFEIAATLVIDGEAAELLVGDVTDDGIDDIVLGYAWPEVQVIRGLGDGSFEVMPSATLDRGGDHWAIARHSTGHRVLTAGRAPEAPTYAASSVNLLSFTAQGDLDEALEIDTFEGLVRIHVGDLDGDEIDDLVVHYGPSAPFNLATYDHAIDRVHVWEDQTEWFVGSGYFAVDSVLGDVDEDGRPELIFLGTKGLGRLDDLDQPTPAFSIVGTDEFYKPHPRYTIGDVDGDGRVDVVGVDHGWIEYALQGDDGTFGPARMWTSAGVGPTTALSIDDDDRLDVVVDFPPALVVHLGSEWGAASFGAARRLPRAPRAATSGDFDGDGRRDLAIVEDGGVSLLLGSDLRIAATFAVGADRAVIAAVDLEGDGSDELFVIRDTLLGAFRMVDGALDRILVSVEDHQFWNVDALLPHDLDDDGRIDLVVVDGWSDVDVWVLRNLGDGTFAPPGRILDGAPRGPWPTRSVGDLNHDGLAEVAISGGVDGSARVLWAEPDGSYRIEEAPGRDVLILPDEGSLLLLDGDRLRRCSGRSGALGEAVTISADPRLSFSGLVFTADVDGDGHRDLALWSGGPTIRRADAGTFPEVLRVPWTRDVPELVDDLDGDGRPDLVLRRIGPVSDVVGFELRLSGGPP